MWHRGKDAPAEDFDQMKSWCERIVRLSLSKAAYPRTLIRGGGGEDGATLSRYCYVVNIALHLPPLIPLGCVFIHHAVTSNLKEWIDLAAFSPSPSASAVSPNSSPPCCSDVSLFSRRFNLFTLTPGKQQINVTVLAISQTCANIRGGVSFFRSVPMCVRVCACSMPSAHSPLWIWQSTLLWYVEELGEDLLPIYCLRIKS